MVFASLSCLPAAAPAMAEPYRLAPYKDDLFAYPKILDEQYDGAYLEVEYDRPRDLDARDAVRGEKVKPDYVSLDPDAVTADRSVKLGKKTIRYYAVGKVDGGARAIVIFVHGLGTGRETGVDDWIHGGNFNRIKNLMMRNDGVYISPSFSNYRSGGAEEMRDLILFASVMSPDAPVFLACGSMGATLCWRLIRDDSVRPLLGGVLLLDPVMNRDDIRFAASLPADGRVPLLITGSREDTRVGWKGQRDLFIAMKKGVPDYPIRYVLFSAGTHGLSWRMVDWRTTLNWMLEAKGR
ncbi:MAG: alpha/beta hydrolase [Bauldia sp.]|nr:alpha/beta hydrolase [Bauldia sp.]